MHEVKASALSAFETTIGTPECFESRNTLLHTTSTFLCLTGTPQSVHEELSARKCDYVLACDTLQASNRLAGGHVVCSDITKFLYSNFYILLFIY